MSSSSCGAQRSGQAIIASSVNEATPAGLRRGGRRIARFAPAWRDNLDGSAAHPNAPAGQLTVTPQVGSSIDPRPDRAQLDAARAQPAQGRAALDPAQRRLKVYASMTRSEDPKRRKAIMNG